MHYEILMFDCYGTLIDWESGILSVLMPMMQAHGISVDADTILTAYSETEPELQQGEYLPYRTVLKLAVKEMGRKFGFTPTDEEQNALPNSVGSWQPFADTVPALAALQKRCRLAVLSNIDRDLFAATEQKLRSPFEFVFTAEDIGAYKPNSRNFAYALERLPVGADRILHVAESLFHDVVPARRHGLATVWVNRRGDRGYGASRAVAAKPDMTVRSLTELTEALGLT
jgi:2-haloacid dehalogenase